ncbi:hypothetical protein XELAEV_18024601mg [Xenopus laevis]|uniref:Uncharacterized protein n=1 Tax=Xenopus laevis TaxID=8355 RepID=A0A974CZ57_XENLA|nr:hypothetical protein XELAEV_18024601mg [Xenopus laevis]
MFRDIILHLQPDLCPVPRHPELLLIVNTSEWGQHPALPPQPDHNILRGDRFILKEHSHHHCLWPGYRPESLQLTSYSRSQAFTNE